MMNKEAVIEMLVKQFSKDIVGTNVLNQKRVIVSIKPDSLTKIAEFLHKESGFRFIIASAIHSLHGFEIHYHFSKDDIGLILNLHVLLDKEEPQIESLSNMFDASNWIEREMHELFGIDFRNHPNQDKLISEGNWAEGVYPYRKEFKTS